MGFAAELQEFFSLPRVPATCDWNGDIAAINCLVGASFRTYLELCTKYIIKKNYIVPAKCLGACLPHCFDLRTHC